MIASKMIAVANITSISISITLSFILLLPFMSLFLEFLILPAVSVTICKITAGLFVQSMLLARGGSGLANGNVEEVIYP